ncbi:MAG: RNase adapter RapZ [Eubacterium sp.]|nr:RNase adapter RapZ [Eubacterium sp.]
MRLVMVSGLSGAGKSSVMKILEDDGYYCVDNLPGSLISTFLQLANDSVEPRDRIAIGLDIRGIEFSGSEKKTEAVTSIIHDVSEFKKNGYTIETIFLEASDEVLIKRYKETRRIHPLSRMDTSVERFGERVGDAIAEERMLLQPIKEAADVVLDTSSLLVRDLKQEIDRIYTSGMPYSNFYLTFVSFGYKYGIPTDADLVFDVRFLPNPYYVEELKALTGDDKEVSEYVMSSDTAVEFMKRLTSMIDFLIPNYRIEGKTGLVIAVGCTGGKHRSVTLTNALYDVYRESRYGCKKYHRDIDKDRVRKAGDLQR